MIALDYLIGPMKAQRPIKVEKEKKGVEKRYEDME